MPARRAPAPRTTSELRVPARPVAARRAPAPTEAASPLRLTRRGRVVVAAAAVLFVVALSLIVAGAAQAISHSAAPGAARSGLAQVVVRPGQSLWSVAETADPDADTRLVIQQIIQLNTLTGDTVFAGQRLWVPRS
jgi:LysM domain